MRIIELSKGFTTRVSEAGYEKVKDHSWRSLRLGRRVYAVRGSAPDLIFMHRVLIGAPKNLQVDHIDGDGLNNNESNLRLATQTQNAQGFCRKRANATSRFRGVSWDAKKKKWRASIRGAGITRNLGRFNSEEVAAKAYDKFARIVFGEFASPNFPI